VNYFENHITFPFFSIAASNCDSRSNYALCSSHYPHLYFTPTSIFIIRFYHCWGRNSGCYCSIAPCRVLSFSHNPIVGKRQVGKKKTLLTPFSGPDNEDPIFQDDTCSPPPHSPPYPSNCTFPGNIAPRAFFVPEKPNLETYITVPQTHLGGKQYFEFVGSSLGGGFVFFLFFLSLE